MQTVLIALVHIIWYILNVTSVLDLSYEVVSCSQVMGKSCDCICNICDFRAAVYHCKSMQNDYNLNINARKMTINWLSNHVIKLFLCLALDTLCRWHSYSVYWSFIYAVIGMSWDWYHAIGNLCNVGYQPCYYVGHLCDRIGHWYRVLQFISCYNYVIWCTMIL